LEWWIIRPPSLLTPTAIWPSIMKPMPPNLLLGVAVLEGDQLADSVGEIVVVSHRDNHGACGP
jgi:hypothetical protein